MNDPGGDGQKTDKVLSTVLYLHGVRVVDERLEKEVNGVGRTRC
jgi:hypothetical protein